MDVYGCGKVYCSVSLSLPFSLSGSMSGLICGGKRYSLYTCKAAEHLSLSHAALPSLMPSYAAESK